MIRSLTGTVIDLTPTAVVIDVQGVGYLVAVPHTTGIQLEQTLHLWTYLAVRETALDLCGFQSRDDLALFEQLLSIPKIGPKSALQIMSQADLETVRKAVLSDDPSYLHKVSGIGKKTAEKIVLGLKDVWDAADYEQTTTGATNSNATMTADVVDALIALGYPPADARQVVAKLPVDIADTTAAVKAALQLLGQR